MVSKNIQEKIKALNEKFSWNYDLQSGKMFPGESYYIWFLNDETVEIDFVNTPLHRFAVLNKKREIAQQVKELFPNIRTENADGYKISI